MLLRNQHGGAWKRSTRGTYESRFLFFVFGRGRGLVKDSKQADRLRVVVVALGRPKIHAARVNQLSTYLIGRPEMALGPTTFSRARRRWKVTQRPCARDGPTQHLIATTPNITAPLARGRSAITVVTSPATLEMKCPTAPAPLPTDSAMRDNVVSASGSSRKI